jgi:hypothetical protein
MIEGYRRERHNASASRSEVGDMAWRELDLDRRIGRSATSSRCGRAEPPTA